MSLKDLPKEFQGKGIRMPISHKKKRLVAMVKADTKVGKTRLLYTMPKPQLQISFDLNSEGQEDEVVESQEDGVYIYEVRLGEEVDGPKELAIFKQIRQFVYDAVETKYFRSIGIDTGDGLWVLCQRGFFGKQGFGASGNQFAYGVPNGAMERIFKAVRDSQDVNLLVAQRVKVDYEKVKEIDKNGREREVTKALGTKVMMGWKQTPYEVHAIVALDDETGFVCDMPKCSKGCVAPNKHWNRSFSATIERSQYGGRGVVLRGNEINFANIAMEVYPTTKDTPEVWE